MKMIFAVIRPELITEVTKALAKAGFVASTKWSVAGRGKQHGIKVGDVFYEEMAKTMLMVIVEDDKKDAVVDIIMENAVTGEKGNSGDGRIFVVPVEESYTISRQVKD